MSIRPAKTADIMALIGVIEGAHARSIYASVDEIDHDYTRQMFARAVHFMGRDTHQGTLLLVSENGGQITGYFFGFLDRLYQIGRRLAATDVHFYLSQDADPRDALAIVNAFDKWANDNERVVEARIGESNIMGEPDGRFGALLERKGYAKAATVFTRSIAR